MAASEVVKRAAAKGKAAAAVVLDANTGEVLARAQWPDFDPGDPSLRERLEDPQFTTRDPKFTGIYGPWPDKTGFRGIYQGGSAAKLFTVAWWPRARACSGTGRPARSRPAPRSSASTATRRGRSSSSRAGTPPCTTIRSTTRTATSSSSEGWR